METMTLPQQYEFAVALLFALVILAYLPSNAELAARFRAWKEIRRIRRMGR